MELPAGSPSITDTGETNDYERPAKRSRIHSSASNIRSRREVGLMRKRANVTNASFVGSSSGIHFIRSVYHAVSNQSREANESGNSPESDVVPGEDDQLSGSFTATSSKSLWRPAEVHSDANTSDIDLWPSLEDLLAWTQSYFDNWHPAYPFVPAPAMLEYFELITQQHELILKDHQKAHQLTILRSMLSICLADRRQLGTKGPFPPFPSFLVFSSFKNAIESIQGALYQPTTMESLQAAVSVQLFLVSMLRHNAASRLGGMIVRMAFQLGLHRCPVRYTTFPPVEAQLRQRLFWSIYCLDRHICQSLGHPLTIQDDDIDVCYPTQELHEKPDDLSHRPDDRLCLLTLLAKAAGIKGSVMELRNKSVVHRQADLDQAIAISTKLSKWENDVEDSIEDLSESESALSPFQVVILTISKHEAFIALNRPLLTNPKESPTYQSALQICISSSRAILTTLHDYWTRNKPQGGQALQRGKRSMQEDMHVGCTPVPLLWPTFTWCVWMSALIILYATKEDQVPRVVATRLTNRSLEILQHISLRGNAWPDACAAAIKDLRSRVLTGHDMNSTQEGNILRASTGRPHSSALSSIGTGTGPGVYSSDTRYNIQQDTQSSSPSQTNHLNQQMPLLDSLEGHTQNGMSGSTPYQPTLDQAWPPEFIPVSEQDIDFFEGYDIPFWMGDDHSVNMLSHIY